MPKEYAMMNIKSLFFFSLFMVSKSLVAQKVKIDANNFEASNVFMFLEKKAGNKALKVVVDTAIKTFDEPTFVKIKGVNFKNGTIEVKVMSRLIENAPDWARGFIGLAFRIEDNNAKFECIYIRPTNGRSDNQIRRNHSIQYFAFPDYKFERLRKEFPELYESYADMGLDEWITLKIEVQGSNTRLFLNNHTQPSLIVNDLKLGANNAGAIGLWVGNWTEGHFKDLKITLK